MMPAPTIPQSKIDNHDQLTVKTKEKKEMEKARSDFIERISVAGWKEAFDENVLWIRISFQLILLILSILCLYYSYKGIGQFINIDYNNEITDTAEVESIPFSNVTVCAQIYANQTFVTQNIVIPEKVKIALKKDQVTLDDFYRQLTLYLSNTFRPRYFTIRMLVLFEKVIAENAQIQQDFMTFMEEALPSCREMLKKCSFNGEEFDCCENAVRSFDDDGVCYQIMLNMDSDNAFPKANTKHQTNAAFKSGLSIEVSLSVKDSPWLDDDAQNGFRILVGPVPFTSLSSLVAAPHAAETFIRVKPERHGLITNCAGHGNLNMNRSYSDNPDLAGGPFMYYDPEGMSCMLRDAMQCALAHTQCEIPLFLHRPNSNVVCKPRELYYLSSMMFSDMTTLMKEMYGKLVKDNQKNLEKARQWEKNLRRTFSEKSRCPNHCQYWTYNSDTSFVDLERMNSTEEHVIYSRIHVYYADMAYRQKAQVKELGGYLAFCEFGNVIGLYWGMSIVSFFHVLYYVPRYAWVVRKAKKRVRLTKVKKVQPVHTTSVR